MLGCIRCARRRAPSLVGSTLWLRWVLLLWLVAGSARAGGLLPGGLGDAVQGVFGDPQVAVELVGIEGELAANVRAFLSIAGEHEKPWRPARIQRLHRRAIGEIRQALQPFGFYRPHIEAELGHQGEAWRARYAIDPGVPTVVTELQLDVRGPGAGSPAVAEALAASQLVEGERLDHRAYKSSKSALADAAYAAGYLDADFERAEIRVDPEAATAQVALVLQTGERYYFGPVRVEQEILDPALMARYVPFEQGEPFDAERLVDLQLALTDSAYFGRVAIHAERENAITDPATGPAPQVPIRVVTEPRPPARYSASVGYGTDTGARVGLGAEFRRLNQAGHKLRFDLRVSEISRELAARYDIPIDDVAVDHVSIGATVASEQIGDATTNQYRLALSRNDSWSLGRRRLYLHLERETFDFGSVPGGDDGGDSVLFYPGLTLSLQRADDLLRPRLGASLSLDVHGGSEAIVSEVSFLQTTLVGAAVLPLGQDIRFLARGKLGATETNDFAALPPSQRFFAGGSRSVRGYGYQEIGPTNADGDSIGGQYLAVVGVELEVLFWRDFGAAVFFDAGDAANTLGAFDLKRGVGIGFRWRSPVGTLRIDFAHPLDDPNNDFRIHFSLGPDL